MRGATKVGAGEVGCVIVKAGQVVADGFNEAELRCDPTAHAEIVALRKLGEKTRKIKFPGCTLYVTLQPCSMCAAACVWAGIDRVVYGATRSDVHCMYFDAQHIEAVDLITDAFRSSITILGGVLAAECSALYFKPDEQPPLNEQMNL